MAFQNVSGFSANDFILIGKIGSEYSEILEIDSISEQNVTVKTATLFAHENKTYVKLLKYNQIKFYEGSTLLGTEDISTDGLTSYLHAIDESKDYSVRYYNSTTTELSPEGEVCLGNERLMAGTYDLEKFEDLEDLGKEVVMKLDLATREIVNMFKVQGQDIAALDNRDLLRDPVALLALYYIYLEGAKINDTCSMKATKYYSMYQSSIDNVTRLISVTDDDVTLYSQTQCLR